jgi:hypothetical protein
MKHDEESGPSVKTNSDKIAQGANFDRIKNEFNQTRKTYGARRENTTPYENQDDKKKIPMKYQGQFAEMMEVINKD